ncbi:hypothetical protein Ddc_16807 [Ditylenchus destructor]|nr:hypothetical protein Ddc_16807 [Ditylenchus destructor]
MACCLSYAWILSIFLAELLLCMIFAKAHPLAVELNFTTISGSRGTLLAANATVILAGVIQNLTSQSSAIALLNPASSPTLSFSSPLLTKCPPLVQTLTNTNFSDGVFTFIYDNPDFPTSVLVNCSAPDSAQIIFAGIVVNQDDFLENGLDFVTFPGTCNTATGQWLMGNPPLTVITIECLIADGPGHI